MIRTPRTLPRVLSPGEVDALVGALRTHRDRAMVEAMAADLKAADVRDPDLDDQHLSPTWALRELDRIRAVTLAAGEGRVRVVTGRNALQAQALAAFGVDTSGWSRARVA